MSELSLTELTDALRDPAFAGAPGLKGVSLTAAAVPTGEGVDVIEIRPQLHYSPDLPTPLRLTRRDLPWTPADSPAGLITPEALLALSPEDLLTMETSAARELLNRNAPTPRRSSPRGPLSLTAITAGLALLALGLTGALLINTYLLFVVSVALIIGGLLALTANLPLTHSPAGPPEPQALTPAGPGRYHVTHWMRMTPTAGEIAGALRGPVTPGVTVLGVSLPVHLDTDSGTVQVQPTLHFTDQVLRQDYAAHIKPHVLHALQRDRAELTRISGAAPLGAPAPVLPAEDFSADAVKAAAQQALLRHVQGAQTAGQLCMRTLPLSAGPIALLLLHEALNLHFPTLFPLCLGVFALNAALLAVIITAHWTDLRVSLSAGPFPRLHPDRFEPGRFSYLHQSRAAGPAQPARPAALTARPIHSVDLREQIATEGTERSLSTLRDAQRRAQALKAAHADDAAFTARLDQLIERTQTEIDARHEDALKRSGQQELDDLEQTVQTELHYLGSLRR